MKRFGLVFTIVIVFVIILYSINCFFDKNQHIERLVLLKDDLIKRGEWINTSDLTKGFSVRGDKIAFFENNVFNSEDIFKYRLVDSVYIQNKNTKKIIEYLIMFDTKDTIYYKLENRSDSSITLKINQRTKETYELNKGK